MTERRRAPGLTRPPGAGRYGWFVGVVLVLLVAYAMLTTATTHHVSSVGLRTGARLPPFAVPLALSTLDGDANVATRAGEGAAGARPACTVRGPRVLNVCQLAERGPVALAFFATRGASCTAELDRLERVRRAYPRVQVAAVAIRGDRGAVRALVRGHRWGFPVGYDRDGALANLYGVAVCPQITLAHAGGRVATTIIGEATDARLRRALAAL